MGKLPKPPSSERKLFDQAMDLPDSDDLGAFLARACSGDEALAGRVAALVESSKSSGRLLPDEPADWTGGPEKPWQVIGNYQLERLIGQGAFGTVWLAQQLEPVQRRVAVKILKLGLDTTAVIARFELERQALAMMDHPNIANVYDAGATAAGRPFFVMEYLDGEPLFKFADSHKLAIGERLALMQRVVAAVQHAHQKGIIHRDLKSSNILVFEVDGKPIPKVIDFGIAKLIAPTTDADLTLAPGSWGTPDYMSPEQLSGAPVDTRSDIFSLGVILYELLSGASASRSSPDGAPVLPPSRCFRQLAEAEREQHASARSSSQRALAKQLTGELDWIVLRAAAAEPAQRYSSAGALHQDIAQFLAGLPVAAGPPTRRYIVGKFIRRYRGRLALAALAICTLVVATVVSLNYARKERAAKVAMGEALYQAHLSEASGVRKSGRPGQRTRALAAIAAAAKILPTAELRDEAIAAMALPDVELIGTLDAIPERNAVFAYDFVSDLLLTGRRDRREIQRYRVETGETLDPVPLPDAQVGSDKLSLSPGGAILAVYGKPMVEGIAARLSFYEVATGRKLCDVEGANYQVQACAFYDSARKVLVPMDQGGIAEIDLNSGKEIRRIETVGRAYQVSSNTAETRFIVTMRDTKKIQIIDAKRGVSIKSISVSPPEQAALSPGGRVIAYAGGSGSVRSQSLAKIDEKKLSSAIKMTGHLGLVNRVSFVLDGRFILTSSWDGTVRLWNASGSQVLTLEGGAAIGSPDGKRMLVQNGKRVRLFRLVPPPEVITFSEATPTKAPRMAFSADSTLAAVCSEEGTILVELPEVRALTSFGSRHRAASFDPDRGTLVTSGEDGLRSWDLDLLKRSTSQHVVDDQSDVLDTIHRAVVARSKDNTMLATTSLHHQSGARRHIRVSNPADGSTIADIPWEGSDIHNLVFDPKGRWLAGSYWRGQGITIWDTDTWARLANLETEVRGLKITVSRDGGLLASGSASEICLWDTSSWKCVQRFSCDFPSGAAKPVDFSPDGKILAYGYDATRVRLLRISDGTEIAKLTLPVFDLFKHIKFSPDGRFLGVSGEMKSFFFDLESIAKHLRALGLDMTMP